MPKITLVDTLVAHNKVGVELANAEDELLTNRATFTHNGVAIRTIETLRAELGLTDAAPVTEVHAALSAVCAAKPNSAQEVQGILQETMLERFVVAGASLATLADTLYKWSSAGLVEKALALLSS